MGSRFRIRPLAKRAIAYTGRRTGRPELASDLGAILNPLGRRDRQDNLALRAIMAAVLQPDSDFIDVGAYVGAVLSDAVRMAPSGRHLAFEPIPELSAELRRRFPQVDIRQMALSDTSGDAKFTFVTGAPAMSGLIRRRDLPRGAGAGEELRVRVGRLDDELPETSRPAVIKIDVEGAEVNVLCGAHNTLTRFRPLVAFEHGLGATDLYGRTSGEVWDLFHDLRFRLFDLDGNGPFSRDTFEDLFAQPVWNYLAVPLH
jgi:FkbM family methyltransferase